MDSQEATALLVRAINETGVLTRSNYKVNPCLNQFRCSTIPYCSRKICLYALPEILEYLHYAFAICESFQGVNDITEPLQDSADSGTLLHVLYQSLIEKCGTWKIVKEDPVFFIEGELKFYGHIDLVLSNEETQELVLYDIKSVEDFHNLERYGASKHHREQLNLYTHYKKEQLPDWSIYPFLWYGLRTTFIERFGKVINFNDLISPEYWRVISNDYDATRYQNIVFKAYALRKSIEKGFLPARIEEDSEKWQCQNSKATCVFHGICYENNPHSFKDMVELVRNG